MSVLLEQNVAGASVGCAHVSAQTARFLAIHPGGSPAQLRCGWRRRPAIAARSDRYVDAAHRAVDSVPAVDTTVSGSGAARRVSTRCFSLSPAHCAASQGDQQTSALLPRIRQIPQQRRQFHSGHMPYPSGWSLVTATSRPQILSPAHHGPGFNRQQGRRQPGVGRLIIRQSWRWRQNCAAGQRFPCGKIAPHAGKT